MMPVHEVHQLKYLRWQVQTGRIGGPDDGAGIELTGARLLTAERAQELLNRIMERVRRES